MVARHIIPAPMLASPGGKPFSATEWLYEIKFDGYRCMAQIEPGQVKLVTKSGVDCGGWYPEVAQALAAVPGGLHVIDGEACVLDDLGRADFNALHARAARRRHYPGCATVVDDH